MRERLSRNSVLGVPTLDLVHRAFGYVRRQRHLWSVSTFIYLEQDAGSGGDARWVFVAPNQSIQSLSLFWGQLYGISYLAPGGCTSRNRKLQPGQVLPQRNFKYSPYCFEAGLVLPSYGGFAGEAVEMYAMFVFLVEPAFSRFP